MKKLSKNSIWTKICFLGVGIALVIISSVCGYQSINLLNQLNSFINWDMRLQLIWGICIVIGLAHFVFVSKENPNIKSLFLITSYGLLNSILNIATCSAIINSSLHIAGYMIDSYFKKYQLFGNSSAIDYITLIVTLFAAMIFSLVTLWRMIQEIFIFKNQEMQDVTGVDKK